MFEYDPLYGLLIDLQKLDKAAKPVTTNLELTNEDFATNTGNRFDFPMVKLSGVLKLVKALVLSGCKEEALAVITEASKANALPTTCPWVHARVKENKVSVAKYRTLAYLSQLGIVFDHDPDKDTFCCGDTGITHFNHEATLRIDDLTRGHVKGYMFNIHLAYAMATLESVEPQKSPMLYSKRQGLLLSYDESLRLLDLLPPQINNEPTALLVCDFVDKPSLGDSPYLRLAGIKKLVKRLAKNGQHAEAEKIISQAIDTQPSNWPECPRVYQGARNHLLMFADVQKTDAYLSYHKVNFSEFKRHSKPSRVNYGQIDILEIANLANSMPNCYALVLQVALAEAALETAQLPANKAVEASATNRPTVHEYRMGIAKAAAARATCERKQTGAIIVDPQGQIIATGHNGSLPGAPECGANCQISRKRPSGNGDPGGRDTTCNTVHAEVNCLFQAMHRGLPLKGSVMYCTYQPCHSCLQVLKLGGVERVIYDEPSGYDPIPQFEEQIETTPLSSLKAYTRYDMEVVDERAARATKSNYPVIEGR